MIGDIPDVSILIVNWNTKDLVERCLESLPVGMGSGVRFETIVVDNGSVDGSADALRAHSDVILLENTRNLGFAEAVNQVYEVSRGALVLLLNSDVELLPGSAGALRDFLLEHPEIAGAAPLYRNPDGSPQPFHFRFPTFAVTLANASAPIRRLPGMEARLRAFRMLDDDFSSPRRVPQPSASCLLLRRSALPPERLFDERYPIFFNDVQFARSLAERGRELWVTPDAVVIHEGSASTRRLGGALKRQYVASVVRMLEETEPRRNVFLYRSLVLVQGIALLVLGRPNALAWRDLVGAVSGRPGSLPLKPFAPQQDAEREPRPAAVARGSVRH